MLNTLQTYGLYVSAPLGLHDLNNSPRFLMGLGWRY